MLSSNEEDDEDFDHNPQHKLQSRILLLQNATANQYQIDSKMKIFNKTLQNIDREGKRESSDRITIDSKRDQAALGITTQSGFMEGTGFKQRRSSENPQKLKTKDPQNNRSSPIY